MKRRKQNMTELELGTLQIQTSAEDGDIIKQVVSSKERIEILVNECYDLNTSKKELDAKLADKRSELKDLLDCLHISKITAKDFTTSNIPSKRFSGWKDEKALLELIPEELMGIDTMSPDRAKIEALVKAKKLPKAVLELMFFKEMHAIRFMPIIEKAKTD